jgi:hypothetical protein
MGARRNSGRLVRFYLLLELVAQVVSLLGPAFVLKSLLFVDRLSRAPALGDFKVTLRLQELLGLVILIHLDCQP